MTRRDFLAYAAAGGAALCAGHRPLSAAAAPVLRVQLLLPADAAPDASARRGAELAAAEVRRAAALLRGSFELIVSPGGVALGAGVHAVVRAVPVSERTDAHELLVLDLLESECRGDLRLQPPVRVLDAARAATGATQIVRWHDSLERFGAAQLNERYRAAYAAGMDDMAWSAWFAVKLLWDAAARVRDVSPAALREFLLGERGVFDGHKGEPLRFTRDGLLLQPLYALRSGAAPQPLAMHDLLTVTDTCER